MAYLAENPPWLPLPAVIMTMVHDFVAGLAGAIIQSSAKIKSLISAAFGDKSLTQTVIYNIIKS
jgi:hypothetical protein